MKSVLVAIAVTIISFIVSAVVFPYVLRFAREHNIVDNPNARKLQRYPVPVLGGTVVFIGIMIGAGVFGLFTTINYFYLTGLAGMFIMLLLGTCDDIYDLSPKTRFLIEIAVVLGYISVTGIYIDDFHGLFGINALPQWVAIALSTFTGVGVINAVNLIDGVDGYSSGYGMLACLGFSYLFWYIGATEMAVRALIVFGALLPFFLHNVFGDKSKMFIGDGGTLMLGFLMTVFSFYALSSKTECNNYEKSDICLIALIFAIGSIPVLDTLRVMIMRIFRGFSPFSPDKTHLHHLFIDMGFSHLGAAMSILLMNFIVILSLVIAWQLGASDNVQFYVVFIMGLLFTAVFYKFMKTQQFGGVRDKDGYPIGTKLWHKACKIGEESQVERARAWRILRYLMDKPMMLNVKL